MLDCAGDTRAGALGTGGPGAQPPGRLSEHRACIREGHMAASAFVRNKERGLWSLRDAVYR